MFLQISQNSQENTKKEILAQMFSCEFCESSHYIFFNKRFGRLIQHKHLSCLLAHLDFLPFQKRCHTYFLAEYFFGLIWRLGTRESSIFHAVSQKFISNPVGHLRLSFFFEKIVCSLKPLSIFARKFHSDVRPGSKYASVSSQ